MAQFVTPETLDGLFKEAYGDSVENLLPEVAKVIKMVPFVPRDKETGNFYHQPVVLAGEQGVTYASATDGAFALEDSVSMTMKDAQIQGSQMLLRSAISYDTASKASNSKKAFVKSTELLVDNMLESITKRLEIGLLHGQSGIGEIAINGFTAAGTSATFIVTPASFASGIWAGSEGAKLFFYSDSSLTISAGTNLNANTDTNTVITVTAVDVTTGTITVTGSAAAMTSIDGVSATKALRIYFRGAVSGTGTTFLHKEMAGLKRQITNTGVLFGIDAAAFGLWAGSTYTTTGQLTMSKVLSAVGLGVGKGLNEKVSVLVNPGTWQNLASDLAALRRLDGSYTKTKGENGVESIQYYGQNGDIEVISHTVVKAGEAYVVPFKRCKRIGSTEVTFKTPGRDGEIFLHLPSNAGFEMRTYSDQALFLEAPAKSVYITGFANV
jgi:hypothetical protein